MLRGLSGDNVYRKGEVYDFPDAKALRLLNSKLAEPVKAAREAAEIIRFEKAVEVEKEIKDVQTENTTVTATDRPGRSKSTPKGNGKRGRKSNK